MNIYEKLANARSDFKKANVKMSGNNSFVGYKYFDLSDILPTTTELEKKYKMLSIITFGKEEAALNIVNAEAPDEKVTFTSPMSTAELKGCHPVQNLGAAESYVRRYLYLAAYEIVESDQLDLTQGNEAVSEPKPAAAPKQEPAKQQAAAPTNNAPAAYSDGNSDITLERARKLYFKSGKNANIPFSELQTDTLKWVADTSSSEFFKKGAQLVLEERQANAAPALTDSDMPAFLQEAQADEGLPF